MGGRNFALTGVGGSPLFEDADQSTNKRKEIKKAIFVQQAKGIF